MNNIKLEITTGIITVDVDGVIEPAVPTLLVANDILQMSFATLSSGSDVTPTELLNGFSSVGVELKSANGYSLGGTSYRHSSGVTMLMVKIDHEMQRSLIDSLPAGSSLAPATIAFEYWNACSLKRRTVLPCSINVSTPGGTLKNYTPAQKAIARANTGTYSMISGFLYGNDTSFPSSRIALAKLRSGSADFIINCIGDSTTAGIINSSYVGVRGKSWAKYMALILASKGVPTTYDGWFGDAAASTHSSTLPGYYPQVTLGSGWSSSAITAPGGFTLTNSTTTANLDTVSLTNADTAVITYATNSSTGSFTTQVDSGAVSGAISTTTGTSGIASLVVPLGSLGIHTLHIARSSGGSIHITGVEFYNSAVKSARIRNLGFGGSRTGDWNLTQYGWSAGNSLKAAQYKADLTIICLGINDWINSVGSVATLANLNTLIANVKSNGGDIIMLIPPQTSVASKTQAFQDDYFNAIYSAAKTNSLPVIEWRSRFPTWEYALSIGAGDAGDPYHPNEIQYADIGSLVAGVLLGL